MITPSFGLTATERVLPSLALDFTTANLDSRVTFTRALDTATRINSSGQLEVVLADTPRFDYDPTTLACKGLLIEESRVNSLRNNTMQGVVAGTPGTTPTNWIVSSTASGITREVVGIGTDNGVDYIDLRYSGTATSALAVQINFEGNTQIAAANGEAWTASAYLKLAAGSTTNTTSRILVLAGRDVAGNSVAGQQAVSSGITPTTTNILSQRSTLSFTFSSASVAFVRSSFQFSVANGATIDLTLRVGLPQLEKGAFATSVIKTSTAAVTRNKDVVTMTGTNFSDWFNATEGTFYCDVVPIKFGGTTIFEGAVSANDGTANNVIALSGLGGPTTRNHIYGQVKSAGVQQVSLPLKVNVGAARTTAAFAYKLDNFAGAADGTNLQTTTSGTLPTVDRLSIMSEYPNGRWLNGHIRKILYWPQRLTNNEVVAFSKG